MPLTSAGTHTSGTPMPSKALGELVIIVTLPTERGSHSFSGVPLALGYIPGSDGRWPRCP